ncbi:hypothetical protein SLA2020_025370 [Shorea laevis]
MMTYLKCLFGSKSMTYLPPDRMTMPSGQKIGVETGHLLDIDAGDGHVWANEYIQVRVAVAARKPLRRGMKLTLQEGPIWVSFRYERFPNFYYCCGKLDFEGNRTM